MLQKTVIIVLILVAVVFVLATAVLFAWPFVAYVAAKFFS